ncbi:phosphodiester glycosidase family protein [Candidatus Sumerlaeota bacterium]|nr:phosphodiester glycosidase family protein [Candidatus Sumerlaeota bacterium]
MNTTHRFHLISLGALLALTVSRIGAGEIAPGVLHTVHNLPGPVVAHVVEVDLASPECTIEMGFAQGIRNHETGREPTSVIAARYDASGHEVVMGINCGFFGPGVIEIKGPLASGGELIGRPNNTWEVYMLQESAEGWIGRNVTASQGVVTCADGTQQAIDLLNLTRQTNSMAMYTPVWGPTTTTTAEGVEVIVEDVSFPMRPDKAIEGTVTAVRTGAESIDNAIPSGGFVLAARDAPADTVLAHVSVGDRITVRFDFALSVLNNARLLAGGAGWLVEGGEPNTPLWSNFGFWDDRHPRTVLAWSGTRHWLVTFDGRQPGYSIGMDFPEMADFLINTLGAEQAINLDGGGSTTMVIDGVVVNCPSDNADPPCTGTERAVANALLLVRRDPTSALPLVDDFTAEGRTLTWDDKFTFNPVVEFAPAAPGGDGWVLEVMDPAGGFETTSVGGPGDEDIAVEALVRCDHRPEVAANGFERVGLFARDSGNGNFESPSIGGGNCYALTFDTDTGRVRAAVVVDGVMIDLRESEPVLLPSDAWRRFRIECVGDRIRYLVDGEVIADATDSSHARGRCGVGYHEYFSTNSNAQGTHAESFRVESLPSVAASTGLNTR